MAVETQTTTRVVFVGDDLGTDSEVDRGITWATDRGVLRSVSLLVTGRTAVSAAHWARSFAGAVGLHLAFCAAEALSSEREIPSLMTNGALPRSAFALVTRALRSADIALEAGRQFDHFVSLVGRPPDFINSHQHAQVHPMIFREIMKLASERGVARVRNPTDLTAWRPLAAARSWAWPAVSALASVETRWLRTGGLRSPDGIVGGADAGHLSLGRLDSLLPRIPRGKTVEIVTHPAWGTAERVALGSAVLPDLLSDLGLHPIDYRDV